MAYKRSFPCMTGGFKRAKTSSTPSGVDARHFKPQDLDLFGLVKNRYSSECEIYSQEKLHIGQPVRTRTLRESRWQTAHEQSFLHSYIAQVNVIFRRRIPRRITTTVPNEPGSTFLLDFVCRWSFESQFHPDTAKREPQSIIKAKYR